MFQWFVDQPGVVFFFSSRRRHTRCYRDWSSDVCSSDLNLGGPVVIPGTDFNKTRDKAFFFFGFEHLNQLPAGTLHQYFVPTPGMMSGDFTAASLAPYKQRSEERRVGKECRSR